MIDMLDLAFSLALAWIAFFIFAVAFTGMPLWLALFRAAIWATGITALLYVVVTVWLGGGHALPPA